MAVFSEPVDWDATAEETPRTKVARFGDGYEQELDDGLNTVQDVWSVEFKQRTTAERDTIVGFFRTNKAAGFTWTPPGGSAGTYKCRSWTYQPRSAGRWDIRARFERVYLP